MMVQYRNTKCLYRRVWRRDSLEFIRRHLRSHKAATAGQPLCTATLSRFVPKIIASCVCLGDMNIGLTWEEETKNLEGYVSFFSPQSYKLLLHL